MNFKDRVLLAVKKIPKGKVSTYKLVSKEAGSAQAFRAVGTILRKNKKSFLNKNIRKELQIPCHRVVKSDFSVGNYCGGLKNEKKKEILRKEGISIKDGKIQNIDKFLHNF